MPVAPTYPGVYVEEIPSGVRTIVGVATSITAFIGRAARGPTDTAVTINSFGDFERIFGGLWANSSLGYAVRDFYLNGGSQAIIVRLFNPVFASEAEHASAAEAAQAVATATTGADIAAAKKAAGEAAKAIQENNQNSDAAKKAAKTVADKVDKATSATVEELQKFAQDAADKVAPITLTKLSVDAVAAAAATAAQFVADAVKGDKVEDAKTAATNAAKTIEDDSQRSDAEKTAAKTVADEVNKATSSKVEDLQKIAQAAVVTAAAAADSASVNDLVLEAAYPGSWGNYLRARIDHDVKGDDADKLFNLQIRDGRTGQVEVFRNVSVVPGHMRQVDMVLLNESKLVRIAGPLPEIRPDPHANPRPAEDIWNDNSPATSSKVIESGMASNGNPLELNDFIGPGKQDAKKGLYALRQADLFNLLCIPPYVDSGNVDDYGNVNSELIDEASRYCEKRRAILLIDPRAEWDEKEDAKTGIESQVGTASKNAAVFFPHLRQPNPLHDNRLENFAPCGAVAGIFARTDTQRGVWKAPAGLDATLFGVQQLRVNLTDAENGELNPLGINCLRSLPPSGRVIWGSRTRVGDDRLASEWKYIPVRRTALYIEESLYRGLHWVVFEPNDEPLWAQIRLNVGAFMHNLFRQGAFQGSTPRDAYFVKCDKETTPQNDINLGIVNIVVGFAPLKPAEFVIIKLQQMAGQIQT